MADKDTKLFGISLTPGVIINTALGIFVGSLLLQKARESFDFFKPKAMATAAGTTATKTTSERAYSKRELQEAFRAGRLAKRRDMDDEKKRRPSVAPRDK
jgi:hypothetical protein